MADFMGKSFSFNTENRMESLTNRIEEIEQMSAGKVPYDPGVARANPVPNPSAVGANVNPAQAQQFQAMMQMMQAKMLSSGLGNNNDDKQSGLESMMQGFGMQGMGAMNGMAMPGGMPGIPGMQGVPGMGGMNGMAMPSGMQGIPGMQGMPTQPGMGMQGIDPALLQQMSQIQMMKNY
ncbi:MAG: hypothetical protein HRT47_13855 [Candidatus Caenarcaniphilales bacterium]|nr:hypothetical protein [Candidatus Caenarcaniphilales bacterium]